MNGATCERCGIVRRVARSRKRPRLPYLVDGVCTRCAPLADREAVDAPENVVKLDAVRAELARKVAAESRVESFAQELYDCATVVYAELEGAVPWPWADADEDLRQVWRRIAWALDERGYGEVT